MEWTARCVHGRGPRIRIKGFADLNSKYRDRSNSVVIINIDFVKFAVLLSLIWMTARMSDKKASNALRSVKIIKSKMITALDGKAVCRKILWSINFVKLNLMMLLNRTNRSTLCVECVAILLVVNIMMILMTNQLKFAKQVVSSL